MSEREKILGRIREALKVPSSRPGRHDAHPAGQGHDATTRDYRRWLPAVGGTVEGWAEMFAAQSKELRADFRLLNGPEETAEQLRRLSEAEGWARVASHRGELTDALAAAPGLPVLRTDDGYEPEKLEKCDAGITECDALVAQTGSVLLTSRSAGGRALSVLPPHHVVLARRRQLVADLPAGFALLKQRHAPDYPSFMTVITGPSRTGDIERILVLGAHGPKKLTIFCF